MENIFCIYHFKKMSNHVYWYVCCIIMILYITCYKQIKQPLLRSNKTQYHKILQLRVIATDGNWGTWFSWFFFPSFMFVLWSHRCNFFDCVLSPRPGGLLLVSFPPNKDEQRKRLILECDDATISGVEPRPFDHDCCDIRRFDPLGHFADNRLHHRFIAGLCSDISAHNRL